MLVKLEQPWNTLALIVVKSLVLGKRMLVKLEQSWNAEMAIVVTPNGIVTLVKLEQSWNA